MEYGYGMHDMDVVTSFHSSLVPLAESMNG